ncbi:hypothetical protein HK100_002240 [Physocladia obscura]|uniref:Autophagy-related protein 101 n=1 Tax=Physocladia obscura TaxID=109957 RepID=A0AAD5SVL4_9FUNG|nr:hypothetical protein HK100_002240 [Physocladia obscura]
MLTRPIEVDLESINLTYVRVDDPEIEQLIEERIASFLKSIEGANIPSSSSSASSSVSSSFKAASGMLSAAAKAGQYTFSVAFSERRVRRSSNWFSNEPVPAPWEQWNIRLSIVQSRTEREQIHARKSFEQQLQTTLLKITRLSNENKDHIPAITTQDGYPFPVQISFSSADQSWGGIIKTLIFD